MRGRLLELGDAVATRAPSATVSPSCVRPDITRPPMVADGFCLFNNAAIAARHLQRKHGYERIAIPTGTCTMGNGTEAIFYDDPSVLYVSLHQYPVLPGTGAVTDTGRGDGPGFNVNVPFSAGVGDEGYALALEEIVAPVLRQFAPQFVLVSAGFDCHWRDRSGGTQVTEKGFLAMTRIPLCIAEDVATGAWSRCWKAATTRRHAHVHPRWCSTSSRTARADTHLACTTRTRLTARGRCFRRTGEFDACAPSRTGPSGKAKPSGRIGSAGGPLRGYMRGEGSRPLAAITTACRSRPDSQRRRSMRTTTLPTSPPFAAVVDVSGRRPAPQIVVGESGRVSRSRSAGSIERTVPLDAHVAVRRRLGLNADAEAAGALEQRALREAASVTNHSGPPGA